MMRKIAAFLLLTSLNLTYSFALPDASTDPRVQKTYDSFKVNLIWIKGGTWSPCAKTLLEALNHVEEEGLWQEDYAPLMQTIDKMNLSSPEAQKKADAILTLAALNYISDMKGERINPQDVSKNIYVKQASIDEAELLKNYLSLPDHCGWVHGLAPQGREYQDLKKTLALYRQKQAQGGWPQLPKGTKLEKGDSGALVETLRKQLVAQDIPGAQGGDKFDEGLEVALKEFQSLHGQELDGKVGPATLTALNTPVEDRLHSIVVSMERQRWYSDPMPSRYIQVNIPGFYLKAVDGGKTVFFMPIITGKKYTKTPVFNAPMNEIIFNPSWHVPASIIHEILPKIESNPEAYARKGYVVTHDDSGTHIVQKPGSANALGKIRFTVDSPFSIYLHGTPSQNLFKKENRSLSHGCIRVENPVKLAQFVFDDPSWTLARIESKASGSQTDHVKLPHPLPVFITYFTVFEDEQGKMNFVPDEYGQDEKVWVALEQAKRNTNKEN
jgi:murein L,D-transpeptidase YcbB/YkuD